MDEKTFTEVKTTKKKHPLERANIISRICFCWLVPFFVKGLKRELNEENMYGHLKAHESYRLGDKLEKHWKYELTHRKDPSLAWAIFKVFWVDLAISGILFILSEACTLSQPLIISRLLKYYEPHQTSMTKNEVYLLAAMYVLVTLVMVLIFHSYMLVVFHLGMKIRVATCSIIYRKALKLSKTALAETTIGQMVNLLSNDVGRFDMATLNIHNLWAVPVETVLVLYLLYSYVGITGLPGILFLFLFFPFHVYVGKKTSEYRLKTAIRTDERVRLMSEIINGIQVIKMYTWEKPFAKLVELARKKEMHQIRAASVIRALLMSFNLFLIRGATYLCILTYVLTGNVINASYTFTLSLFYQILGRQLTMIFPFTVTLAAESYISIKRIKTFLMREEINLNQIDDKDPQEKQTVSYRNGAVITNSVGDEEKYVGVNMAHASVKWIPSLPENVLEDITFHVNSNQLVAVVGPVGGGKTTLLHAILKELPPVKGTITVHGTISYASQEPWLFGGSVRQNIIFGQEFDAKRYQEVVRVCALERDFSLFPYGDRTLVGDRGVTLSGGQRARINLARAVYKEADIYLLDDPLSAVDTQVGKQLFDECICKYLKGKCVVLVTHQLQYLRSVNTIYLLENGRVEASGSYTELQASDSEFTKLLSQNQEEEEEESNEKSKQTENIEENKDQNVPVQEKEQRGSGIITWDVYKIYLKAGGNWFKIIMLASAFLFCQLLGSLVDYFALIWVNVEQIRSESSTKASANDTFSSDAPETNLGGSFYAYMDSILTTENAVIIYGVIMLGFTVLAITRSISFFNFCIAASTRLHNLMFSKIVYATMRFFNTNPPGRILNRFSKDIGAIDETLPRIIIDTLQIGLSALAIILVVASLNPWILLPTVIITIIFYGLRVVFLASSRDVKRLEAVTRSPIYTHLSASLQGLTTIRAFGAQEILRKEFDNFQNQNSAAYFLFLGANRTFGLWLDVHCVIYIALVAVSVLFVENEVFGGNVGLSLTQSIGLCGIFQYGIRQWSELENQMTSVERVHEYTVVTPEANEKIKDPPKYWPEKGSIKFDRIYLRYSPDEPYVLNNLNFEIKSGEKIGIVGRTGAGKSSLIAALFRLTGIEGNILIDDINTKEILLDILRSNISIIPQEPVLFSGTLRKNLDPFDEYNDEILWNALEEVELKHAVTDLPAGLDSKMSEGGSNFSVGQRQLFCLARAIIRNNKILVLDEATANVDPYTDALIQATIRRKFSSCTVLTIAHRLHTIMDSDKVLVMDAGKAVEFDHPHELLQNRNGVFYGLVLQTGKAMAQNLTSIAQENFRN